MGNKCISIEIMGGGILIQKRKNLWNIVFNIYSGGVNSLLSVVWVGIITRILGVEEAGVFTLAYSAASLWLTVGYWGMRNFQVSDSCNKYRWVEYRNSRILTTFFMIIIAAFFCLWMNVTDNYSDHKSAIVFGVTLLKALDAIEDVYHGKYQQDGKLYLAGFFMGSRLLIQMGVLSIILVYTRNLFLAVLAAVLVGIVVLIFFLVIGNKKIVFARDESRKMYVRGLLRETFPLFAASFISFFLNNMPKYMIDIKLNDIAEAYFGYISIPVFIMFLLSNFIYTPYISDISVKIADKKIAGFVREAGLLLCIILVAAVIVMTGGALVGIPGLELICGVDLKSYRTDFLIILSGSILYACATYFLMLLTVLRAQRFCMIITILTSLISFLVSNWMIEEKQIKGAAMSYMISMLLLFIFYLILVVLFILKEWRLIKQR